MPKVTGPAFSISARGSISPYLTFSVRGSGQQVRYQRKQQDYTSAPRAIQRALYSLAVSAWNSLDSDFKEFYRQQSMSLDMTGYNLFVKLFLEDDLFEFYYSYYGYRKYGIFTYGKTL